MDSPALVDRTLDPKAFREWAANRDNPWTHDNEREEGDVTYVNILLNPEHFTGMQAHLQPRSGQPSIATTYLLPMTSLHLMKAESFTNLYQGP
ncbi:hypothetical protein KP509_18G027500 [Ceratopteris richardii]|uniref:Uncharacterized protein n=1 Tax=Ceratopteris richardii TaxID=49495 RepID=A0A8T2SST0_CERRI|nr:hypothetical protein KP509_18G027500 [Ceratopteris richardii]